MEEKEYLVKSNNIIIDTGSGYTKAGLSFEREPNAVFPTIVGYPKYYNGKGAIKKNFGLVQKQKIKDKYLKYIIQ